MPERRTTSSGTTNCQASDSGFFVLESAATLSSTEQEVGLVDTQLGFTEPGRQRPHAEKQRCKSVGSLGVMIPSKTPTDHRAILWRSCLPLSRRPEGGTYLGKGRATEEASTIVTDTGHRASQYPPKGTRRVRI